MLFRIEAPHFAAGGSSIRKMGLYKDELVVEAAPIIKYMKGWYLSKVASYCKKKNWEFMTIEID